MGNTKGININVKQAMIQMETINNMEIKSVPKRARSPRSTNMIRITTMRCL
jgi:hypothetical protein